MMRLIAPLGLALMMITAAASARAECYADYKAKQDDPLRLHYGVIQLPDPACADKTAAAAEIGRRIAGDGWQLLTVVGIFGEDGLGGRKDSAADYYLRY